MLSLFSSGLHCDWISTGKAGIRMNNTLNHNAVSLTIEILFRSTVSSRSVNNRDWDFWIFQISGSFKKNLYPLLLISATDPGKGFDKDNLTACGVRVVPDGT